MTELRNSLADLAEQIREAGETIAAAERTSVEHALRAGFLLCQAKDDCQHGEWLPFLARANVNERTAQRWMQIARAGLKSDTVSDLGSVRAALDYIAKLQLPEPGDILFVSREGHDEGPLACAWISHAPGQPGFFDITSIKSAEEVLSSQKPLRGEPLRFAEAFFNPVWVCLDVVMDIPHEEREFVTMPAEMLDKDTFDFLGDLESPVDLSIAASAAARMPASYDHAVARMNECIADYSLDRAKAAWRAVRALCAKMGTWPSAPGMAPVYARIATGEEITQLEGRVRALVRAHNPELFTRGAGVPDGRAP